MKNRIMYIVIIVLLVALGVCITINFTRESVNKKSNNTDIIDIDCNGDDCKEETKPIDKDDDKKSDGKDTTIIDEPGLSPTISPSNGNIAGGGEIPAKEESIIVKDSYKEWSQNTEIKIFKVDSIGPGDHDIYDFYINNNTYKNVKYNMVLNEDNKYKVNMKYKLKRNNEYIAGSKSEWVNYSDLDFDGKVLNAGSNDYYSLEWKWVDADNDTEIGRTPGAKYGLKIAINAAETDEIDPSNDSSFNPHTGDNILYYIELALLSMIILMLSIIKLRQKD